MPRKYKIYKKKSLPAKFRGLIRNEDKRAYIISSERTDLLSTEKDEAKVFNETEADRFMRNNDYAWKMERV